MATFKEDLSNDLDETFFNKSEFAEDAGTCIYYPAAGGSYEVAVIFDNEFETVDPDSGERVISRQPVARINENDLQAAVKPGDEIEVRGVRYKVIEPQYDGVGTVLCLLHEKV